MTIPASGEESQQQLFVADAHREYDQAQAELREIDVLIQQSTSEVEKLARRHAQASNQLRHIQANFETVPREDIRESYDRVLDIQQRLFTMRGQLEKLQSDQRNTERLSGLLHRLLEITGGLEDESDGDDKPGLGPEVSTVVRVVGAQEAERRRLSRDMHDGPAQSMTNFILQTEICQRLFETDVDRARAELIVLKSAATDTFQQIRDFIFELRPMMLDDLGLVPTIRRYAELYKEKHNLPLEVTVVGKERRLEPHVETTLFRITQELLNNVSEHAQATQVNLTIDLEDEGARMVIDDNGSGFNVEEVMAASAQRQTLGLSTMFERVEMFGGSLKIDSTPGQGTHVVVTMPTAMD